MENPNYRPNFNTNSNPSHNVIQQNANANLSDNNTRTLSSNYESLDYDTIENVLFLEHQHKSKINRLINRDLQRWLAIFLIALATALSGFLASISVRYLTHMKFLHIINATELDKNCFQKQQPGGHNLEKLATESELQPHELSVFEQFQCMFPGFLLWASWNGISVLFGSLLVTYVAPISAGSGIPVVKCYLNGVKIPGVVHFKTYMAKILGVISSVVGGLAAGKEGPFIHCGAALGAGISQGKSASFNLDTRLFKSFRNDRDKRDFVSAGASAGVAAAFGAPIGGVLFALEEGASFWNQTLTWRLFFCSMMTSFILNILMVATTHQTGILSFYSLVNFGLVEELDYFWFEIPIYLTIAVLGGVIGASFCYLNLVLTRFRRKWVAENWKKVLEAVLVAIVISICGCFMILLAPECRDYTSSNSSSSSSIVRLHDGYVVEGAQFLNDHWRHPLMSGLDVIDISGHNRSEPHPLTYDTDREIKKALEDHVMRFMCPPGQYSAMSSLWLKTSEGATSTFMVLQEDIWSMKTLTLFLFVYYILAVLTYGLSVSSGVFIPSLLIGATGGRLIGLLLRFYLGPKEWLLQLNKFALIGAASVLGGVTRMTISLTVIIIEATGCISFGMPIMLCLMVSKWIADSFIEGLYDLAIHMANVPFLDWDAPSKSHSIYATDVMSPNVRVLRTTETVANLISILKENNHHGFPVVDFMNDNEDYDNIERRAGIRGSGFGAGDRSFGLSDHHLFYTPNQTLVMTSAGSTSNSDSQKLISGSSNQSVANNPQSLDEHFLIGSFQRCSITSKRESHGRFRGLVLRWQILIMLELKIFNENERSYENLNLEAFQRFYPRYPSLEQIMANLKDHMYSYHVDLRSIMNTASHTVSYSSSLPRIYQLFRSLGLRHLVVIDDRNEVVGMITRKDLARYVKSRDRNGAIIFSELKYTQ